MPQSGHLPAWGWRIWGCMEQVISTACDIAKASVGFSMLGGPDGILSQYPRKNTSIKQST
jgi:hypothetical protein